MEYLLITENENALNFADSAFSTVALQQELKSAVTFSLYEGTSIEVSSTLLRTEHHLKLRW